MLLGIIRGYINQYVNQYFENIDASQLTGNVFYGAILHNLNLRKNMLELLDLPFRVVGGKCGTLEIQYTWYKLYSEPVVVKLKDLHILVIPARTVQYGAEGEKEAHLHEKLRQLEVYETMKKHMNEAHYKRKSQYRLSMENKAAANPPGTAPPPSEGTYFDTWVLPILNNIQFQIESIHLRFEDDFTKKLEPFAVGVTIQNLSVLSTDSEWNSHFVTGPVVAETNFKLVKINGVAVYWNPAPTVMYKGLSEKAQIFEKLAALPNLEKPDPAFKTMFGPISFEIKVKLTVSPDTQKIPFNKPTIQLETTFEELLLTTTDKQIKDILPFIDTLDILWKGFMFRKFRPNLPEGRYSGHYKEWWQFAHKCVMVDITRRRNNFRWKVIAEHRAKCAKYLKAYYKKNIKKQSSSELDRTIKVLEVELDLFNLILLRKHAELIEERATRDRQNSPESAPPEPTYVSAAANWVWSWWAPSPPAGESLLPPPPPPTALPSPGRSSESGPPPLTASPSPGRSLGSAPPPVKRNAADDALLFSASQLNSSDKEKLKIAVGFAKDIDVVNYPVDYVDLEANTVINRVQVKIKKSQKNNHTTTIFDTILDNVNFQYQIRPKNNGMVVQLKMGKLEAYGGDFPGSDYATKGNVLEGDAPQILSTANRETQEYFLKFLYEAAPLDTEGADPPDHKVSLEGLAIQFIYHASVIDRIADCFHVDRHGMPTIVGPIPTAKVLKSLSNFRNYPTSRVLRIMENRGKAELNICLVSPRIVIPQESTNGRPSFFVVELGTINLMGTVVGGTICEHGGCSSLF